MKRLVVYVHGKGGSAAESGLYRPLFPCCDVVGLDYRSDTPWEAGEEIRGKMEELKNSYSDITLIANSIGAYFCLCAGIGDLLRNAYFISPVVDMERMIRDMLATCGVTEQELRNRGVIKCGGEVLSWEYLRYAREHPVSWEVPTAILYGAKDLLVPLETVTAFGKRNGARSTVFADGGHWFHTADEIRFLTLWIQRCETGGLKDALISTMRLQMYPSTWMQMEEAIAAESDEGLKAAYTEMLTYSLRRPEQWEWYAMWRIERTDGTPVGDLCFKGLREDGICEVGYGIRDCFQRQGYATEAVMAAVQWALGRSDVRAVEAETEADNAASQRVLEKCGFQPNGTVGEEGPRFVLQRALI